VQVPAPFDYERATSVEDALARLARLGPEARIVAGGHSLLPMMKLRIASPDALVDINDLAELDYVREQDGELRIGALTRHRELKDNAELSARFPVIAEAERHIADPIVRNRGTIGGSLCQGDPAEDLSAVCTALKASVVIRGAQGERVVAMSDFHRGPYETAVADGELLTEVRIPIREHHGSAQEKVERRAGDWAITACVAALWMNGGTIADAGIALSAVGPTTITVTRAEDALRGNAPSDELFAAAAAYASEDCSPADDARGPADYKRHLARELTHRALRRAAARALEQEA
jgi:carbon-monoxide dehydrogenase medium subunit